MKDCRGEDLAVGDLVATTGMFYRDLAIGRVLKFTKKGIRVNLHYLDDGDFEGEPYGVMRTPAQVAKLEVSAHAS